VEAKAYLEGIWRRWWIVGLAALLFCWIGMQIAPMQAPAYTASTTILLNDAILANTAFPSNTVQLTLPDDYRGAVLSPALLYHIMKTYPHLTIAQLEMEIVVSNDQTKQLLLINVTDSSPFGAADIANLLARNFVQTQMASLTKQLNYYQQWLQQNIARLNDDINKLNIEIDAATPTRPLHGPIPTVTSEQRVVLKEYQYQINQARRAVYDYQQALTEVQHALPLIPVTYMIVRAAVIPRTPVPTAMMLPTETIELIIVAIGVFLSICLIVALDFSTPLIRHQGELCGLAGVTAMAELPRLGKRAQRRLMATAHLPATRRMQSLHMLSASLSVLATKSEERTILLTSPRKKQYMAAIIAALQASYGYKILLIDADFKRPSLHKQMPMGEAPKIETPSGYMLSWINKTIHPNLFLLPATAMLTQGLTGETLLDLLPVLRNAFDLIVLAAPPLQHTMVYKLASRATQAVVFVQKRRDTLKMIRGVHTSCEALKIEPYYVFLT